MKITSFELGIYINEMWNQIGIFDAHELNISKLMKPTLWEARESARMEAYNKLIDRIFDFSLNSNI